MILQVDPTAAVPVYEQIRLQVVRMVVAETLTPGTRLPTIRQLANDLQVAKGTVAKAYTVLEEAQVVETRGRRGTFTLAPRRPGSDGSGDRREPKGDLADAAVDQELTDAAEAFIVVARQLGIDFDRATEALAEQWPRPEP